jgi:hypothetical protein
MALLDWINELVHLLVIFNATATPVHVFTRVAYRFSIYSAGLTLKSSEHYSQAKTGPPPLPQSH